MIANADSINPDAVMGTVLLLVLLACFVARRKGPGAVAKVLAVALITAPLYAGHYLPGLQELFR